MAARSAEVKSYVLPDVKIGAQEVYARWGMSLSDAINTFLIKSIEVGGLPFDMQPEPKPVYDAESVIAADPKYGASVLPSEMDNEEDEIYASFVH